MGTTRVIGAAALVACLVVLVAHIYFGYISSGTWARGTLAFALPITVGVLVVCGLGMWLGWIMVTTKEVSPPPAAPKPEEKKSE